MSLYIPEIPIVDFEAQSAAGRRLVRQGLAGRLGALEPLVLRLAAVRGGIPLSFPRKTLVLLAADHGHALGDPAATAVELALAARGQGAVNALARQAGAELVLADLGSIESGKSPGVQDLPVGRGTVDWTTGPALSLPQVQDALLIGMNLVSVEIGRGLDVLAVGEIAAGGDLAAAAALHVVGGVPLAELIPDEAAAALVRLGVESQRPDPHDPLDMLRTMGGIELAGLAGAILAAAAGRVPIILDGVVSVTAAYLASHLNPAVRAYLLAGHRSGQPAHDAALRKLGLRPLLSLGMSQGAGCGAAMAFHLVEAAARLLNEPAERGPAAVEERLTIDGS